VRRPVLLDPKEPNVRVLPEVLARTLVALYTEELATERPVFPEPKAWTWGSTSFPLEGMSLNVVADEGAVILLRGFKWLDAPGFRERVRDPNVPARIDFADETQFSARFATWTGSGTTAGEAGCFEHHTLDLECWTWQPRDPAHVWVAQVHGPRLRATNLVVCGAKGSAACGLRVECTYDVHLLKSRTGKLFAVVDTRGAPLDLLTLGHDFQALEFALGSALRFDPFVAVDGARRIVGAAGPWSSPDRSTRAQRCPVPAARPTDEGCWIPVFARLLATKMRESDREDSPLLIASTAYLDSLSRHVHGRYLVAQVALEAIAKQFVKATQEHLVADVGRWKAFVAEQEKAVTELARDAPSATKLMNKLRDNIFQAPAGDRVVAALQAHGLVVPQVALTELSRRNWVAHDFVMFRDDKAEPDDLAMRIAIVQTLLVALVAKHIGYRGPILGWEQDKSRSEMIPAWWPHEDDVEAHRRYLALEDGPDSEGAAGSDNAQA
jgi:hypothetical protein